MKETKIDSLHFLYIYIYMHLFYPPFHKHVGVFGLVGEVLEFLFSLIYYFVWYGGL